MISVPSDLILQLLTAGHDIAQDLANAMWPWLWVFIGVSVVGILLAALIGWISESWNHGFGSAPEKVDYKMPEFKPTSVYSIAAKSKFLDSFPAWASFLSGKQETGSPAKRYEFVHTYTGLRDTHSTFRYTKDVSVKGGLTSRKTYDNLDKPNTPQDYEHDGWIRDARTGNKLFHDPHWKPKTSTKA